MDTNMLPFVDEWTEGANSFDPFSGLVDFNFAEYDFLFAEPSIPPVSVNRELPPKGSEPVVQTFYDGPDKCDCCINWIEKKPEQLPESERGRYDQAAICLYRCRDHENEVTRVGGLSSLRCNRLVIQSQLLIDLIRPTLQAAGAFVPEEGDLAFTYPFKDLYFSYNKLMELSAGHEISSVENALLRLLEDTIKPMFSDLSTKATQFRSKGTIDYDCLWTLFPKGMLVYYKHFRKEMLLRVTSTERRIASARAEEKQKDKTKQKIEHGLYVYCEYIGFDGSNFGSLVRAFDINKFDGERKVNSLVVYPLGYHLDKTMWQRCMEYGKKLFSLQSVAHRAYEGFACRASPYEDDKDESFFVTGRVIVDPYRFNKTCSDEPDVVQRLGDELPFNSQQHGETSWFSAAAHRNSEILTTKLPWLDWELDERPSIEQQQANRLFFAERPHLLVLIHPCVVGYSLSLNGWFEFHLNKLRDVTWTRNPLENLIFDTSIKQMLASFSKQHFAPSEKNDGPLASKGQGLVVLLSGPSGTGKTLTAEVVAEENKLPLYRVMAGQLGSSPSEIEAKLEEILGQAIAWNAVILLDEADTFIRSRKNSDRITSEIVSIFLRRLEYFSGIVFLTTNMPHDIDEAFRSRCRLHIPYQKLNSAARQAVWKLNFVKAGLRAIGDSPEPFDSTPPSGGDARRFEDRSVNLKLDEDDIQHLVSWKLSGREIQNAVQNVALWCKADGVDVTYDRLKTAINLTVPYASRGMDKRDSEEDTVISDGGRSRKRPRLTVVGASR